MKDPSEPPKNISYRKVKEKQLYFILGELPYITKRYISNSLNITLEKIGCYKLGCGKIDINKAYKSLIKKVLVDQNQTDEDDGEIASLKRIAREEIESSL